MFNLFSSLVDFFKSAKETYNFSSMSLKRGRGSSFWTPEKESKMLELFSKNYSYEDVGRAIGATRGQLATRVRMLRQKGIEVTSKSCHKKDNFKTSPVKSSSKKQSKKQTKQIVDSVIKELK